MSVISRRALGLLATTVSSEMYANIKHSVITLVTWQHMMKRVAFNMHCINCTYQNMNRSDASISITLISIALQFAIDCCVLILDVLK